MDDIRRDFQERCEAIERYLAMLRFVEESGVAIVSKDRKQAWTIDATTQHVLKASVILHLYNLVESTITACLNRIAEEIRDSKLSYEHLVDEWRHSWLAAVGKAHDALTPEKRLRSILYVCDTILDGKVIEFTPSRSLNVDDKRIENIVAQYGIRLVIPSHVARRVKRHVHDKLGTLELIRQRRNDLAHGLTSFAECGRERTVRELREWRVIVVRYLRSVIKSFESYLTGRGFERTNDAMANGAA